MSGGRGNGAGRVGLGRLYGLGYVARLIGFVFGIPALLVFVIGWPLPTYTPTPRSIVNAIIARDYDPKLVLKLLACVIWVAWALMVVSLLVALWGRLRHARVERPRIIPAVFFRTATKWISGVTMVASSLTVRSTPLPQTMIKVEAPTIDPVQSNSSAVNGQITRSMLKSIAPGPVRESVSASVSTGVRSYTVAVKQSIWEVAESVWGSDASIHYPQLLDANQDRVADPDLLLSVGTELRIPDIGTIDSTLSALSTSRSSAAETVLLSEPVGIVSKAGAEVASVEAASSITQEAERPSEPPSASPTTPSANSGAETVVVEKGDSFWSIAEDKMRLDLGREPTDAEVASYWSTLVASNQHLVDSGDPDLIQPGEVFDAPATGAVSDVSTTEPVHQMPPAEPVDHILPSGLLQQADTDSKTPESSGLSGLSDLTSDATPAAADRQTIIENAEVSLPVTDTLPASGASAESRGEPATSDSRNTTVPGLVLTAVGAGAILAAISRRRRRAKEHANDDEALSPLSNESLLRNIRSIASADRTMTLDAAQRFLRRQVVSGSMSMPPVSVFRVGEQGLEIRLRERSAPAPRGFVAAPDGESWFLSAEAALGELDDARRGEGSMFPSLVSLGTDSNGAVLVDLESFGALSIETADPDGDGMGVMAAMLAELEGAPWLDRERIEIAGIGLPSSFENFERIQLIDAEQGRAWASRAVESAMKSSLRYPQGIHALRTERDSVAKAPQLVFLGPGNDVLANALARAAMQRGSGLAVVSVSAIGAGASSLSLVNGGAVLRPAGIVIDTHVCLSREMAVDVGGLIDSSDSVGPRGSSGPISESTDGYTDADWPYDR